MRPISVVLIMCLLVIGGQAQASLLNDSTEQTRPSNEFEGVSVTMVEDLGKPDNFYWKRVRQNAENLNGSFATFLNGQFVCSLLGFDKMAMQQSARTSLFYMKDSIPVKYADSVVVGKKGGTLYYVKERPFSYVENYICPDYRPRIALLPQTWLKYAPRWTSWCTTLFLFNDFLLTRDDLHEFRYDSDYVTVDACTSRGFLWGREDVSATSVDYEMGNLFILRMYDKNYSARQQKTITFIDKADGDSLVWYPYREENKEVEITINKQSVGCLWGADAAYLASSPLCWISIRRDETGKTQMNLYDSSYRPEWMNLEEVLDRFYPSLGDMRREQRYLFFVNGMLLTEKQRDLLIDKNYIHTVRIYDEKNNCVVVSIYTKIPEDVKEEYTPVRIG